MWINTETFERVDEHVHREIQLKQSTGISKTLQQGVPTKAFIDVMEPWDKKEASHSDK